MAKFGTEVPTPNPKMTLVIDAEASISSAPPVVDVWERVCSLVYR